MRQARKAINRDFYGDLMRKTSKTESIRITAESILIRFVYWKGDTGEGGPWAGFSQTQHNFQASSAAGWSTSFGDPWPWNKKLIPCPSRHGSDSGRARWSS